MTNKNKDLLREIDECDEIGNVLDQTYDTIHFTTLEERISDINYETLGNGCFHRVAVEGAE